MSLTPKQRAIYMTEAGFSEKAVAGVLGIDLTAVHALMFEADPDVTLPGGGAATEQVVYQRNIVLDNDQIKALPTTPVELIPAPGPGKVIFVPAIEYVGGATLRYKWRGGLGNVSVSCLLTLKYNALPIPQGEGAPPPMCRWEELRTMLLWNEVADLIRFPGPSDTDNSPVPVTNIEDKSVALWLNNDGAGNLTNGHEDNELQVRVEYSIIDL